MRKGRKAMCRVLRTTLRAVGKVPRTLDVSLGPIDVMFKEMPKSGDETSKRESGGN